MYVQLKYCLIHNSQSIYDLLQWNIIYTKLFKINIIVIIVIIIIYIQYNLY